MILDDDQLDAHADIEALRSLIGRLANRPYIRHASVYGYYRDQLVDSEPYEIEPYTDGDTSCIWCFEARREPHASDCAWVEARALLGSDHEEGKARA